MANNLHQNQAGLIHLNFRNNYSHLKIFREYSSIAHASEQGSSLKAIWSKLQHDRPMNYICLMIILFSVSCNHVLITQLLNKWQCK